MSGAIAWNATKGWVRPRFLLALVAGILVVGTGIYLDQQAEGINEQRLRSSVQDQISLIRARLEGSINANIQLVRGLVSTISTEPDLNQERFAALAANLFEEDGQLRSVAAAPDLVVSMTYPLEGNERAIGLDYRSAGAQSNSVFRARDTGELVLSGPVSLVQGGRGFVARFPVFVHDGADVRFWGIVSAVIDIERMYTQGGLLDPDLAIDISITDRSVASNSLPPFFGTALTDNPVTAEIILPPGRWEIAAVPKTGWHRDPLEVWLLRLAVVIGGALILLPIGLAGRISKDRQRHLQELTQREIELEAISRRLGLALDSLQIGVWDMDMETNEFLWDDRMNEIYGLPKNGFRGYESWRERVHPDDIDRAEEQFVQGIRDGGFVAVYRLCWTDGQQRTIKSVATVYADAQGNRKILGVNWDITADMALHDELTTANALTEARNVELEAARVNIEHNSLHDSLTGLPNRRYLDEMLTRNACGGFGGTRSIALLHIDLDRFKQINDTLGHAAGDAMLVHASGVLRENSGPNDFVPRVGGDEFVVLTSAVEGELHLGMLAEKIVKQMRQPVKYEGHDVRFGVSIGIAAAEGEEIDVKRLLINADIALYRAKGRGRNRFEFFSEELQAEVVRTKRVADEILSGLERNEFVAWFQPQFDAHTLEVVGVEALARWQHPTEGIKAPDAFLPIAEELNVVATVDRLILEQTLAAVARWDAMGLNVPRASVNVSLRRLHDEDLIKGLRQLAIEPGRMSFELVESIYLDENDSIVSWNIDQIKELGIDVEIDDFGTGYASIVSLQKLRPTRLKIDRQLVNPILVDHGQRQLLASIVDIGKSMGIEVVAEGVETMEHAAILRDLGCDILQGYAFSRPLSSEKLEEFLRAKAWKQAS
ncbi:EAL domain-containing protein [Devosia sp. 2618]|uniref:bifunctional diguanylate cyclase/phosphodiesterase n=1 Tax=Devosia sp. 2618 TaxID=3156454 RepID=UPI00339B87C9